MLKPLIKYSGGKFNEYDKFKQFFPEQIDNYYEPFFGGGGVFFRLHNDGKVKGYNYINDYSSEKSSLPTPQRGHWKSSGRSSNFVPAAIPLSASPSSSS